MIIFLPINLNICFDAQKNCLIETVLLSMHNILVGLRNKIILNYKHIWRSVHKKFIKHATYLCDLRRICNFHFNI